LSQQKQNSFTGLDDNQVDFSSRKEFESNNIEELLASRSTNPLKRKLRSASTKTINLEEEVDFPNFEKLKVFLQTYYRHKTDGTPYTISEAIKEKNTGSIMFCFDEHYKKNDLYDQGGPGLRLYFNFLKVIILLFTICSIISLPMQSFNVGNYRFQKRMNE
jgi:hypothetical protein